MVDDDFKLNEQEMDALKEVGNIGTGNAATALASLLGRKVDLIIPQMDFIPIERFADALGGADRLVVSNYMQITGDYKGESLLICERTDALKLIDMLQGMEPGTTKVMDEMAESTYKEMANIVIGAYLNSLADFLGSVMMPSVPHATTDMAQSIVDFVLIKVSNYADSVLSIKTSISVSSEQVNGMFIILFDKDSLYEILKKIKEKYGLE